MASRVCVRIRKGINHCSQMAMASGTVPGGTSAALATSTDISSVSDLISQLNNSVALCLAADQAVKPTTLRFTVTRDYDRSILNVCFKSTSPSSPRLVLVPIDQRDRYEA